MLAIVEDTGIDQERIYLFDPSSRLLVETLDGTNDELTCTGSATGVDLTKEQAAPCLAGINYQPLSGSGWEVQPVEPCGDAGAPAGDASTD